MLEFFHFSCTSEDINNLAHALMLKEALNKVIVPSMDKLIRAICDIATTTASIPMLSRTHGQVRYLGSEISNNFHCRSTVFPFLGTFTHVNHFRMFLYFLASFTHHNREGNGGLCIQTKKRKRDTVTN